jgi:uncharacterized protein YndB with AHSA1/START domain
MQGHLIIADISGYTRYLTESELDHAHAIIGELLNAILGTIRAPLSVSRIEGDAVFLYGAVPADMNGQVVLESVEQLYVAFSSAMETMVLNTTCRCNACANIGTLGLKIVMHCGQFEKTNVGGIETLTGTDVILAHRLLKNHIREATGIADYLYLTQACVDDLGIHRIVAGWTGHTEEYEHIGEVRGYVASLRDVWEFARQQNEDRVVQREAWHTADAFTQAPPAIVWDHLTDPVKRNQWMNGNTHTLQRDRGGRIGPGTEYHCVHGVDNDLLVFTILDRRVGEYITFTFPAGDGVALRYTEYVVPSGQGSRIVIHFAAPHVVATGETAPPEVLEGLSKELLPAFDTNFEELVRMCEAAHEALLTTT